MNHDEADNLIDPQRTVCLCDVGESEYIAAVAIAADGSEHLLLAHQDSLGNDNVRYDAACSAVRHEQLGPLPLDITCRVVIACRTPRCGHPTRAGAPCRMPVSHHGATCARHRTPPPGEPSCDDVDSAGINLDEP